MVKECVAVPVMIPISKASLMEIRNKLVKSYFDPKQASVTQGEAASTNE